MHHQPFGNKIVVPPEEEDKPTSLDCTTKYLVRDPAAARLPGEDAFCASREDAIRSLFAEWPLLAYFAENKLLSPGGCLKTRGRAVMTALGVYPPSIAGYEGPKELLLEVCMPDPPTSTEDLKKVFLVIVRHVLSFCASHGIKYELSQNRSEVWVRCADRRVRVRLCTDNPVFRTRWELEGVCFDGAAFLATAPAIASILTRSAGRFNPMVSLTMRNTLALYDMGIAVPLYALTIDTHILENYCTARLPASDRKRKRDAPMRDTQVADALEHLFKTPKMVADNARIQQVVCHLDKYRVPCVPIDIEKTTLEAAVFLLDPCADSALLFDVDEETRLPIVSPFSVTGLDGKSFVCASTRKCAVGFEVYSAECFLSSALRFQLKADSEILRALRHLDHLVPFGTFMTESAMTNGTDVFVTLRFTMCEDDKASIVDAQTCRPTDVDGWIRANLVFLVTGLDIENRAKVVLRRAVRLSN